MAKFDMHNFIAPKRGFRRSPRADGQHRYRFADHRHARLRLVRVRHRHRLELADANATFAVTVHDGDAANLSDAAAVSANRNSWHVRAGFVHLLGRRQGVQDRLYRQQALCARDDHAVRQQLRQRLFAGVALLGKPSSARPKTRRSKYVAVVVEPFRFARDGFTVEHLNVGDDRDFGDSLPGLIAEGFVVDVPATETPPQRDADAAGPDTPPDATNAPDGPPAGEETATTETTEVATPVAAESQAPRKRTRTKK
jgi:hypothetical protein